MHLEKRSVQCHTCTSLHALQANNAATEGADGMAPELSTSKHDNVAAATASGVDSAIAGAEAQGEPRCKSICAASSWNMQPMLVYSV